MSANRKVFISRYSKTLASPVMYQRMGFVGDNISSIIPTDEDGSNVSGSVGFLNQYQVQIEIYEVGEEIECCYKGEWQKMRLKDLHKLELSGSDRVYYVLIAEMEGGGTCNLSETKVRKLQVIAPPVKSEKLIQELESWFLGA